MPPCPVKRGFHDTASLEVEKRIHQDLIVEFVVQKEVMAGFVEGEMSLDSSESAKSKLISTIVL